MSLEQYIDEFEASGLRYEVEALENGDRVIDLRNLKSLDGMEVAELLTYLHDDGYTRFGPMSADSFNGALMLIKPE